MQGKSEAGFGSIEGPDRVAALVYDELRRIARRLMRREGPGHTLQPTALVHEAYVRLAEKPDVAWRGRTHFRAAASAEMRRILVDHARTRMAAKRGGHVQRISLEEGMLAVEDQTIEIVALDEALSSLAARSPRQARIAEMRIFAGMLVEEVAEVIGVSERTVKGDWRIARAWLIRALGSGGRP